MVFLVLLLLLAALCIGSFLNVVIARGPAQFGLVAQEERLTIWGPRSRCPSCKTSLGARDLIPLVSYFATKAKCRHCAAPISSHYPLIEALTALGAALCLYQFGLNWTALACFGFIATLIALGEIDRQTGYLPDMLTMPLLIAGLLVNMSALFVPLTDALIGALAGFISFWATGAFYRQVRKIDGLGLGDAKLLGAIGAWGGWMILPIVVLIAAAAGLFAILIAKLKGREITGLTAIRFGPFLAFAGALCVLWPLPL